MWADNETSDDLLGFTVHKDVVKQLVTTDTLLPVTVGLFGDWGSGKSSIIRMLLDDLDSDAYPDVACLYFNGWTFEGYDDAKAALISSILVQLGEHKRFGPRVRSGVVRLLKKINYMRLLGLGLKYGTSIAVGAAAGAGMIDAHLATTLAPFIPGMAAAATASAAGASTPFTSSKEEEPIDWQQLIAKDQSTPGPLDIRTFRHDFERLLGETGLRALVVVIDDLDRCSPERLIENLEAIKLFLAVPKTAFVIAADHRIVRYAIMKRYATSRMEAEQSAREESYDLATDYLEKLIQVPYRLPRLSPSEIESYMTLLFCKLHLLGDGEFVRVQTDCVAARKKNMYLTYGAGAARAAMGGTLPEPLEQSLQWVSSIAPALTEGLKGNPRQVKRFLNALLLRKQLAMAAGLNIRDIVLVKLMLLEYIRPHRFDQLYEWQARSEGRPAELQQLEQGVGSTSSRKEHNSAGAPPFSGEIDPAWQEKAVQDWLRLEPQLATTDLRDYFWIARDRLTTTISGLTMVPPLVRALYDQLVTGNEGELRLVAPQARDLGPEELAILLRLLGQQLLREPQEPGSFTALVALIEANTPGALERLLDSLEELSANAAEPNMVFELHRLTTEQPQNRERVWRILQHWSSTSTRAGKAAQTVVTDSAKNVASRRG